MPDDVGHAVGPVVLRRHADGLASHCPQARVLDRLGKNFDRTTKPLPKPAFKSNQPNEIHPDRRVELNGKIYVAVGLSITPSNGPNSDRRRTPPPGL